MDETAAADSTVPVESPATASRVNTKVVISVVLGTIGVVSLLVQASLLSLVCGLLAVVLGHLGLREITTSRERSRAAGIVGLTTGYLSLAIAALSVVALLLPVSQGAAVDTVPNSCTSKTGNFSKQQLQRCVDDSGPFATDR